MPERGSAVFQSASRRLARCAVVILCPMSAGCLNSLSNTGVGDSTAASAVQHPTLENVPVPSGFSLVDDHSVASSSGRLRMVMYELVGATDRNVVNRFYKEYMPSGGWTLKREVFHRGTAELHYVSDSEECVIRIKPEGRSTVVLIDVVPLPKGSVEREASPAIRRP